MEYEKVELRNKVEWYLPGAGVWVIWGDVGQKVKSFSWLVFSQGPNASPQQ